MQRAARRAWGGNAGGVGDAGAAGNRLDTPMISATAQGASRLNHNVSDLTGNPMGARVELTTKQESRTDAGRNRHIDQLAGAACRAPAMLAEGSQVRVVMKKAWNTGGPGEDAVKRNVAKARQVGRTDDQAGGRVDRAGQADSERSDPARRGPLPLQRLSDRRDDSRDDVLAAASGPGRLPHDRTQTAAIIRHGDP